MRTNPLTASRARSSLRTRFILVNDRVPRADAYCALCCAKIEQGYARESQTRLLYCDAQCFAGHEKWATAAIERRARSVS
jgi:hypothetical protein